ncbi:hypothetical protein [Streptomyces sp. NBC_01217]|nr:hypothetical protein OG507_20690 [Streptomyces sp. NBC_01217]
MLTLLTSADARQHSKAAGREDLLTLLTISAPAVAITPSNTRRIRNAEGD